MPAGIALILGAILHFGDDVAKSTSDRIAPEQIEFFEKRIRPLLVEHCYSCHSTGAKKIKGELFLDSRAGVHKGGVSGPLFVLGKPDDSLLMRAVRYGDLELRMPPKGKLTPAQIADLETWIKMGAPDPRTPPTERKTPAAVNVDEGKKFWSFQPVRTGPPPAVKDKTWPKNPIDHFILATLEKKGLRPAPSADARTLIRRMTFDLTGLPPTPEEVDEFVAEWRSSNATRQAALAKVVERLLASSAYGERWGRHWLDVVRYADTAGDNSDYPIPQMIKYRDWVIDAFNRDMPYDQFVREQIAGDLMPAQPDATEEERAAEQRRRIIATGYLANSRRHGSYEDARYPWHLTIEDTIDNFGKAFLGLTLSCARCHDHKFDPLLATDYYGLYGFFSSTRYPWPGIELEKKARDLVPVGRNKELVYAMLDGPNEPKKRIGQVGDVHVQIKGDPERPGPLAPRRFPQVLGGQTLPPKTNGSGRFALAQWLTDPANPLFARVMVNRIWQYHFGQGIVATPNDFGKQGRPPSHPELLDFLAQRFVADGWSIKALHRLIILSATYQQASDDATDAAATLDPDNAYHWQFARRRLDAEAIRDALLAVSGALDRSPGGPHPFPDPKKWDFTQHKPFKAVYDSSRRSVYLMTQRIQRHPFLSLFDGPDTNASTATRTTSTTSLQALYLMNDPFVHEQARRFAARLLAERPDDASRIERAFQLSLGRPPTDEESTQASAYLAQVGVRFRSSGVSPEHLPARSWQSLARALFMSSEFVYVN